MDRRTFPSQRTNLPTVDGMHFPSRSLSHTAVLLLALLIPWAHAAQPQSESSPSAPLASIQVTGSARFHSEQIAAATGLHAGDNITRDDLQAAANRLVALGLFASVNYTFSTVESGVRADYVVADAPTL